MKLLARADKLFLLSVMVLVGFGFFIFLSSAMGLATRDGASFAKVVAFQGIFGVIGGSLAFLFMASISYEKWRAWSFYILLIALIISSLVFIPQLGMSHGGARRWLDFSGFTVQPGEIVKIAYVLYLAAWLAKAKEKAGTWTYGFLPFLIITAIPSLILLLMPDTDTTAVMILSGLSMYFVSGAKIKHLVTIGLIGIIVLSCLVYARPYLLDRFKTYINPGSDTLNTSYQVQQSLIAIGSGGILGNGFGQSLQKFKYLPEPTSDSIFSVASEEFGFVGALIILGLYLVFMTRGFFVGTHAKDVYGRLVAVGLVMLVMGQVFINISSMLGLIPISGITLPFVSHGSSSLIMTLASAGIILNISRYRVS